MNDVLKLGPVEMAELEDKITSREEVKALIVQIAEIERWRPLAIRSAAQHDEYNGKFLRVKKTTKEIEEIRKAIVGPFNKQVDAINAYFKSLAGKLAPTAGEFERALLRWRRDQEVKEQERLRKAKEEEDRRAKKHETAVEEALDKGEMPPPPPAPVIPIKPKMSNVQASEAGKTHTAKDHDVEVYDMKALAKAVGEGKVPVSVLDYKLKALKDAAKAGIELPGCRVTEIARLKGRTA